MAIYFILSAVLTGVTVLQCRKFYKKGLKKEVVINIVFSLLAIITGYIYVTVGQKDSFTRFMFRILNIDF